MCNGRTLPAWQARTLALLQEIPEVEISQLIIPDVQHSSSKLGRLIGDPKHLLWNLYNKTYIQRRSAASRGFNLSKELAHVPEMRCRTIPVGKFGERLADDDIARLRGLDLDVIIRFAFGILKGPILEVARYGVWSFHHGDEREYRGQPPGFWEMVDREPTVGTILQRITERLDGGAVLHRGKFRVTPHSYRRTRDEAFMGAVEFPATAVRRILSGDLSKVTEPPSLTDAPLRRSPGNIVMMRFLLSLLANFFSTQWNGLARASKWTIGIIDRPIHELLESSPGRIKWLKESAAGTYLADPFPDPSGNSSYVLVEDYDHNTHRGVISAVDLDGDGKARVVLDTGVHASYPFLFENGGWMYCVPETFQAEETRLYRTKTFPEDWELAGTILDGLRVLDPTIFHYQNRWWLLCTLDGAGANTKLYAFHAGAISGPWEPHLLNPIKTDISSSRPGGVPFVHNGDLYRPAQDSSHSYGGAVVINKIETLTPTNFLEHEVQRIHPVADGKYPAGIHTLSGAGAITVVDGRRDLFVFSSFRRELAGRMRRFLPGG
jgi:hypothetical protein